MTLLTVLSAPSGQDPATSPGGAPHTGARVLLRTDDPHRISAELAALGIGFERWAATATLAPDAGQPEILAAYAADVARLTADGGYRLVDVVRMRPDESDPTWPERAAEARNRFLAEHTHDEDEVRFFVEGQGCFYLHVGDRVYAVVCRAGDLLSVPAGTTHWFDMGARPEFCAIRFFQKEDGWVGHFTGDPIASRLPYLDGLLGETGRETAAGPATPAGPGPVAATRGGSA
ncbi:1,2-dihydroxy-3-keto-5-methylthiopentene dioxygenase [Longispora urticae]